MLGGRHRFFVGKEPFTFWVVTALVFATIEPSTVTPRATSLPDPRVFPPALA
jgi:hypothetical protein